MPSPAAALRTLLAQTSAWQTLTGATGTTQQKIDHATAAIHLFGVTPVPDPPFIIIDPDTDEFTVIGAPNTYSDSGTLAFRIRFARPSGADNWEEEFESIDSSIRSLATQALALSGLNDSLCISRINIQNRNRSSFVEDCEYWEINGSVAWP